jgi:hypothetical protein
MPDTSFSIELQGITLPDGAREKIESGLRTAVMTEIAKLDLGKSVRVEPLPTGERSLIGLAPIFGFMIRNLANVRPTTASSERNTDGTSVAARMPLAWASVVGDDFPPFGTTSTVELLDSLYLRPDVRLAAISNSRAFAELLSRDDEATRVFGELVGELDAVRGDNERFAPLVIWAVVAGAAALGAAVGYASRK